MEEQHSERTGHCLCGAVTLTAHQASNHVGACHCTMCRRWSGGPYVEINCGTHLFYRVKETGQCMVPAGLFDDDQGLAMQLQVFIDEKPAYYDFANETETMTGTEVFAMFR